MSVFVYISSQTLFLNISKRRMIMSKLAIDGGSKVFAEPVKFDIWPPVYPEVAGKLVEVYMSHKWSFYGANELKFAEDFAKYHPNSFYSFLKLYYNLLYFYIDLLSCKFIEFASKFVIFLLCFVFSIYI